MLNLAAEVTLTAQIHEGKYGLERDDVTPIHSISQRNTEKKDYTVDSKKRFINAGSWNEPRFDPNQPSESTRLAKEA